MNAKTWLGLDGAGGRLLAYLARHGPKTVRDLVDGLDVTTTAVREQVSRLLREGWLVRSRRHGRTGRPADVYALSQKAKRLYADRTELLARLLLDELAASLGPTAVRTVVNGVGRRLAESARGAVGNGPLVERMRRLAGLLGGANVIEEGADGRLPCLAVYACPYAGVAGRHPELCEMEEEMIGRVLGQRVRRRQRVQDGHRVCEFGVEDRGGGRELGANG